MNTNVPSVTLQTAVLMQVKEFASTQQPFSVHDVTRAVRSKTSQGELEIPEVEVAGASFRFDIPHSKVKGIFDELWRTGVFDPTFTLDRKFTGMYYEYTPQSTGVVAAAPVPTFAPVAPSAPIGTAVPTTSTSRAEIIGRVRQYLDNCVKRNFRPTLKQVQSAIKRGDVSTGYTCPDLETIITNDLGLTVVTNPDSVAASQVATV